MANTKLIRTPSSASNQKTFTISVWFKIGRHPYTDGGNGTSREIIGQTSSGHFRFMIKSDRKIRFYGNNFDLSCNRIFSDHSAFYHAVLRVDMTQGTREDRIRLYINGVDERTVGGYATDTIPAQGTNLSWNTATVHQVGGHSGNYDYFSGVMSHIHHCDGASLAPTVFGSTDSTTGEWKINTSPTFTPGTNGFTILKDGNTITDQSSNSNNFSLQSGAITKTEDNPSNVFATLNPLDNFHAGGTFLQGNNRYNSVSSKHDFAVSTLGMPSGSGKFYAEFKMAQNTDYNVVGISDHGYQGSNQELSEDNYSYAYYNDSSNSAVRANGSNVLTSMPNYGDNDIIGVAVDLENHKLYFSKNGTYINSGNPASGSTGTGAVSINNLNTTPNTNSRGQGVYFFAVGLWNTSAAGEYFANFGNGYFGTAAVSSPGTNASGNGIFEYDVPSGYTAISTKGLNT